MSLERIVVRGELHLSLQDVAECYRVEVSWLHEVIELGLLGRCERARGSVVVAATRLDRVAEILRLQRQHGVNLEGIAMLLGIDEEVP